MKKISSFLTVSEDGPREGEIAKPLLNLWLRPAEITEEAGGVRG